MTKRAAGLTREDLRRSGRSASEIGTLIRMSAYAADKTNPFPDVPTYHPTLVALVSSLAHHQPLEDEEEQSSAGEWLRAAEPTSGDDATSRHREDDEDDADLLVVAVDASSSPARQALHLEFARFQLGAAARFLPWDWDVPVPPEREGIARLVARTLENPPDHATRLLAAITTLALAGALGIDQVVLVPLGPVDAGSHLEWIVDLPMGVMRRATLRRAGHWVPSGATTKILRPASDALEIPIRPLHSHPLEAARRWAHTGRQPSERLRRGARLDTVRAHHLGSRSCKPSAGSPSGRRMTLRSTASAIAPSRPRCTTLCSSTRLASSPTLKPARAPSCPGGRAGLAGTKQAARQLPAGRVEGDQVLAECSRDRCARRGSAVELVGAGEGAVIAHVCAARLLARGLAVVVVRVIVVPINALYR